MFEFLKDMDNYEDRKLDKTKVNGITVSTVFTSDEGYETAIIDEKGTHPVERYKNKEEAEEGHKKWCREAKTIKTVTELGGFEGLVEDKKITISRGLEN